MAETIPDAEVSAIRRWHLLHRDATNEWWRIVDALLAAIDEPEDRLENHYVEGLEAEIDSLKREVAALKSKRATRRKKPS